MINGDVDNRVKPEVKPDLPNPTRYFENRLEPYNPNNSPVFMQFWRIKNSREHICLANRLFMG